MHAIERRLADSLRLFVVVAMFGRFSPGERAMVTEITAGMRQEHVPGGTLNQIDDLLYSYTSKYGTSVEF